MFNIHRLKDYVNKPFRQAFSRFADFLQLDGAPEPTEKDQLLVSLFKWVITVNGQVSERALAAFRDFLLDRYPRVSVAALIEYMRECRPLPPSESAGVFSGLGRDEQLAAVVGLIRLAMAAGSYTGGHRDEIMALAGKLQLPMNVITAAEETMLVENERHLKLVRSGTGLLAALIVLVVFILTATWLRSVIYGLILAYICLPLEKLIERRLLNAIPFTGKRRGRPKVDIAGAVVGKIRRFVGTDAKMPDQPAESLEKQHRDNLVKRACTFTVAGVMLLIALLAIGGALFGMRYVNDIGHSVKNWADHPAQTAVKPDEAAMDDSAVDLPLPEPDVPHSMREDLVYKVSSELDRLKAEFQTLPVVSWGIGEIARTINDKESQQRFFSALLQKSGGIIQFSLGMLSVLASILVDVLLTIFFFSLFLRTVALNTDNRGKGQSLSSYCVRTVFNGRWLPAAGEETLREAERIVGTVVFKLKTWLRGYIILISIDFIVYSTFFTLLDVPYAPILGFIAGCGLLLPYIGPIASALLTILVTLALGGDAVSGTQIAGIVAVYLIENGIIEQFFLYPAVIGEALGLTTLETIIVVLLGGIFAGITGMIFALPAAAVIKYLVPQLYHTVRR